MLIIIYKCLHNNFYPKYFKHIYTLRSTVYSLRGTDKFHFVNLLFFIATTSYCLHSLEYFAWKTWNSLPENIKKEPTLIGFKRHIETVSSLSSR